MTTKKRYEILNCLPTYGQMYVPVAKDGEAFYSEGFPVRFYKTDRTEWVANFKPGWTDLKEIIEFENSSNLLVVACGICYLMNPNSTKPIEVFGVDYSDIFKASNDRFILHDQTKLTIIETDGTHWDTERISWDGLAEIKVENNLVIGLSYDPMHDSDVWDKFTYDLDTRILIGVSFNKSDIKNAKPWWKIW